VRRIHEKLFYRPLLSAVARIPGDQARLTPEAASQRLLALGYEDPSSALRHLTALSGGVSRRAAIQKTLLPVMLGWFAETPRPDNGLLAFRRVSDALGSTPWYLRLLRDESLSAERLAHLLAASPYVSEMLLRAPDSVALLADTGSLAPRDLAGLATEVQSMVDRHETPEKMVEALRAFRRRELLRIASADVLGLTGPESVATGLSDAATATLQGAVAAATESVFGRSDTSNPPLRFAVIGMGRLGGNEMGYASDADVLYVFDPANGTDEQTAARLALEIAEKLSALLAAPGPDPALQVDADLRPEGKNGPLVRSLSSYEAYYQRWSAVWESQALLRARPIAGDPALAAELMAVIEPIRYPANGLTEADLREIRRIKARVEAERLPRGADPALNAKLGRGGLADVEWLVQTVQLRHAHAYPKLRTTSTIEAPS
jgi:glutamate-ammonia-ligase adenylyltransferase